MSDFKILHKLIKDDVLAEVKQNQYGRNTLVLTEAGNKQKPRYAIEIGNVPNEIIAIKADAFPSPDTIFKSSNGKCKRADFIIITKTNGKNWIICLEMKGGNNGKNREIVQQLKGAQCLVAYCRAIGRAFWQAPTFLKEKDYQQRFVSIKNVSISKRPMQHQPKSGLHDKPENMLIISASGTIKFRFDKLTGKY